MFKNVLEMYLYTFLLDILRIQVHQYGELQAGFMSRALTTWMRRKKNTSFGDKREKDIQIYFGLLTCSMLWIQQILTQYLFLLMYLSPF